MKVKDGFKFGVGFMLAYDLYKSILHIQDVAEDVRRSYDNGMRIGEALAKAFKSSRHRDYKPTQNKIGFTID